MARGGHALQGVRRQGVAAGLALGPIAQRVAEQRRDDFEQSKFWIAAHSEPYAAQLRVTPLVAAERTLAWAAAGWGEAEPVSSAGDIVQVLLHGIVAADDRPAARPAAASIPETQKV